MFCGVANALYGLVVRFTASWSGLWTPSPRADWLTGTYVNRNHFGGLMELCIGLSIGLLLWRSSASRSHDTLREWLRGLAGFLLRASGQISFYIVIMFAALLLSTSRGASAALFIAIVSVLALSIAVHGRRAREMQAVPVLIVIVILATLWFGISGLSQEL